MERMTTEAQLTFAQAIMAVSSERDLAGYFFDYAVEMPTIESTVELARLILTLSKRRESPYVIETLLFFATRNLGAVHAAIVGILESQGVAQ